MTRPIAISGATWGRLLAMNSYDKTMKSVPAHALGVEMLRDCVMIYNRVVSAMERRIKTGDLRKTRETG